MPKPWGAQKAALWTLSTVSKHSCLLLYFGCSSAQKLLKCPLNQWDLSNVAACRIAVFVFPSFSSATDSLYALIY